MLKEFKDFIAKGNMLDLAVGIVIGVAFTAIITSLVKDVITPLLGIFGSTDFSSLTFKLKDGVVISYGSFLTAVINFVLVALVLFIIVKAANKMKRQEEAAHEEPEGPTKYEVLLTEIRDLLKAKA